MTKGKKPTKGEINEMMKKLNNANNKKQAVGMGQDVINQIATAAERTRVGILESVTAEITALEEALKGAVNAGAPEIPAALLTAIAAVKANATQKAWLGFFGVYHQYGIVPRAAAPGPIPVPEEVPPTEPQDDADSFAEETAGKVADDEEEAQAAVDLAAEREKPRLEREKKH